MYGLKAVPFREKFHLSTLKQHHIAMSKNGICLQWVVVSVQTGG
jgi:hypothetical protein